MSGGSSSSAPTQQTVTQTNIPDYARPYVEDMLGRTSALTDTNQNPYKSYTGARVAGPTEMQNHAWSSAMGMQVAPQIGMATGQARGIYDAAGGMGHYDPNANFSAGNAPSNVRAMSVHSTPGFERTGTGTWNQQAAQQYMDPYMQSVVDIQKREAARQSAMQREQNGANAVANGAFGGTRDALVEAERERNLTQQMGDIQAKGSDAAYSQALNAYGADQSRGLQSQMANQGAGLTWGGQNLQGQMANQGANLQGQMANQGAGLTWNQQQLAAQQAGEQSRQFGAGLGMQGLQTQLGATGLMQGLGQNQFNQQAGIAGMQNQFGQQAQATNQATLDANYQNWVNQQMWPYRQLEFQNSIVHGNYSPNQTTSLYGGYGSPTSQIAGIGTAAYGMSKMMAQGGQVEDASYRDIPDARASYTNSVEHYAPATPSHYSTGTHASADYSGTSYPGGSHVYADSGPDEDLSGLAHLLISKIQ